jgi:hypothetical protein
MRICFFSLSVLLLASVNSSAESPLPRIGVIKFITNNDVYYENYNKSEYETTVLIRNMVHESIFESGNYEVLGQREIDGIFEEQKISVRLFANRENISKFQALNIDYLLAGMIVIYGSSPEPNVRSCVSLNLFDITSGTCIAHETQYLQDRRISNSFDIISKFINNFISNMNSQENSLKKEQIYKIGDFGPAGGIIRYDKGYYSEGWRFIERAPPEAEFEAPWGAYGIDIPDTKTGIGYGKRNTQILVEYFKSKGEAGTAAQLCDDLEINGYDDWYLPSKEELVYTGSWTEWSHSIPYKKRTWYWSSSQVNCKFTWAKLAVYYDSGIYNKKYAAHVRAIRYF